MDREVTGRAAVTSLSREGRVSVCVHDSGVQRSEPDLPRCTITPSGPLGPWAASPRAH